MTLREGFTTGTCAAAGAWAATNALLGQPGAEAVGVTLPDGATVWVPVAFSRLCGDGAEAGVYKDAGDDPDITNCCLVRTRVDWQPEPVPDSQSDIRFAAGAGVGTVTKPGLQIPPGEPAINPVPRRMIRQAVRQLTERPVTVTISIDEGKALARKTFNPRLGIVGGLSVLGTSGRVRPFSHEAVAETIRASLRVTFASGVRRVACVPGHVGSRSVAARFAYPEEAIVEVSNVWDVTFQTLKDEARFDEILVAGHPGKLMKLAEGHWNTHSSHSPSAVPMVAACARELGIAVEEATTVEGIFSALPVDESKRLADGIASRIRETVNRAFGLSVRVALFDMKENLLGTAEVNG